MKTTIIACIIVLSTLSTGCAGRFQPRGEHRRADGMVDLDAATEQDVIREVARDHLSAPGPGAGFRYVRTPVSADGRRHDGDVALLVVEGGGPLMVGTKHFEVQRGSVVTVPAGLLYGSADESLQVVVISRNASMSDLNGAQPVQTAVAW